MFGGKVQPPPMEPNIVGFVITMEMQQSVGRIEPISLSVMNGQISVAYTSEISKITSNFVPHAIDSLIVLRHVQKVIGIPKRILTGIQPSQESVISRIDNVRLAGSCGMYLTDLLHAVA